MNVGVEWSRSLHFVIDVLMILLDRSLVADIRDKENLNCSKSNCRIYRNDVNRSYNDIFVWSSV